jgi:hypothetical protein
MTGKYEAEAIRVYTKLTDLQRRAASAAKAKEVRLPDYFTIEGRIRCKPATLIQTLVEDLGGDVDRINPRVRIAAEKKLEVILRRYNVHPSWIPFIEKVMDQRKIDKWK